MNIYNNESYIIKKIIIALLVVGALLLFVSYQVKNPLILYVSAGSTDGNGSIKKPFGSIDEARLAVQKIRIRRFLRPSIIIEVDDGEYPINGLTFEKKDSGLKKCPIIYTAKNPGKAILNGGIILEPSQFSPVSDLSVLSRLNKEVSEKIVSISLFDLGINPDDYGKIGVIGSFNTAAQYDGDWIQEQYCELFYNDNRMTIARYPNDGYTKTESVISEGYGLESVSEPHVKRDDWNKTRNPESDVYEISQELSDRIASWKTTEGVWMFGYWSYDWADASTPIGYFDAESHMLSPKFVSLYGTLRDNAPFYFFNVLEELDVPGEWYLDRENGILYIYPFDDFENASIVLSISTEDIICSHDVEYLTLDGFVIEGTRSNGLELNGNHITVSNCLIKNIGSNALTMTGSHNLAYNNEITRTGKGGITLTGGDIEKLTPGENIADNNLIHDWSEVYTTYCPAISINGVGNICRHNEIYNSPHTAITFSGNDHVIEYNEIHNVCLQSSDAGAIYSGRHWDWYGTMIDYNYLYDIGVGHFTPNGIYLDDSLSGITIKGNVLVNIAGNGILLGGGRDLNVENNLIVSCEKPILYDARAIQGTVNKEFWYNNGLPDIWKSLNESPWKSEIWQKAYPQIASFSDILDIYNPNFVPNPANSVVIKNVEFQCKSQSKFEKEVISFSRIINYEDPMEAIGDVKNDIFVDPDNEDYHIKDNFETIIFDDPYLQPIPFSKIGRQQFQDAN